MMGATAEATGVISVPAPADSEAAAEVSVVSVAAALAAAAPVEAGEKLLFRKLILSTALFQITVFYLMLNSLPDELI